MKKLMAFILALWLLTGVLPAALATETTEPGQLTPLREPGQCGENLFWSYDRGTLTISGNGNMDDFEGEAPWAQWKAEITQVIFTGNVTSVGGYAFTDYDALEAVNFGSAMHTVGYRAFKSCDSLTAISLPSSFRRFGEEAFMSCAGLTQIYCDGAMPSFNLNCLWDTYTKIYYPTDNPWPLEHVQQLEDAFQGRIEFLMDDGTDPYVPQPTLPAQTQPQETEPVETMPPETVPARTEPATQPQTETTGETTPATETTSPDQTEAPTHAAQPDREPGKRPGSLNGIWIGLFLVTGVLSFVLLGALIFRRRG